MEVYLIRHTTPDIAQGVCYGRTDLELKKSYTEEFSTLVNKLPDQFDAIYTSPLKRCALLANHISPKVRTDRRLMEYNFGDWEMMRWEEIPTELLSTWKADFVNYPAPAGESLIIMNDRVMSFFSELVEKTYKRVAVVTHSVVIRIVLCLVEGKPLSQAFESKLNYGEVLKVKLRKSLFI